MAHNGRFQEGLGLFSPGQIIATPGALVVLAPYEGLGFELLLRHFTGDWAGMDEDGRQDNRLGVEQGDQILSRYALPDNGQEIWIVTEANRRATTFLLPEEY